MLYVNPIEQNFRMDPTSPEWRAGREKMATQELEHTFAYTLLQELRDEPIKGGLFEDSNASQIYNDMMTDALSDIWAKTGQLGIANMVARQLAEEKAGEFSKLLPVIPAP